MRLNILHIYFLLFIQKILCITKYSHAIILKNSYRAEKIRILIMITKFFLLNNLFI